MKGSVFRLLPPRPDFMTAMSDEERAMMTAHAAYWTEQAQSGRALAFGPVADPAGLYGLAIVLAEDLAAAEALRAGDPAAGPAHGMRTEIAPMVQLVTPGGAYAGS